VIFENLKIDLSNDYFPILLKAESVSNMHVNWFLYIQTVKASTAKPACTWQCDMSTMDLAQMQFEGVDLISVRTETLT